MIKKVLLIGKLEKVDLSDLRLDGEGRDGVGNLCWILCGASDASQHALDLRDPGADGGSHAGQN